METFCAGINDFSERCCVTKNVIYSSCSEWCWRKNIHTFFSWMVCSPDVVDVLSFEHFFECAYPPFMRPPAILSVFSKATLN